VDADIVIIIVIFLVWIGPYSPWMDLQSIAQPLFRRLSVTNSIFSLSYCKVYTSNNCWGQSRVHVNFPNKVKIPLLLNHKPCRAQTFQIYCSVKQMLSSFLFAHWALGFTAFRTPPGALPVLKNACIQHPKPVLWLNKLLYSIYIYF